MPGTTDRDLARCAIGRPSHNSWHSIPQVGVSLIMRRRWRIFLPAMGLILFSAETYHSFRVQREIEHVPSRYFWWSAIRLDTDPASKRHEISRRPCLDDKENCTSWDIQDRWVDPGWMQTFLLVSALPAFAIGGLAVRSLGKLGISQLSSFLVLMPILIICWYCFVGWLLDRWHESARKDAG